MSSSVVPPRPPMTYWARVTLTVVGVLFACYLLYVLRPVVVSVLLGLFFAVGLEPAVAALERRGVRRGVAILLIFLAVLGVLGGFLVLAVPSAVSQFSALVQAVPGLVARLTSGDSRLAALLGGADVQAQLQALLGRIPGLLTTSVGPLLGVASAVLGGLFSLLTVLVLTVYFMLALPRLRASTARLLARRERVALLDEVLGKISAYVIGQLSIVVIAGVLAFVFLTVIGAPFPAVLGLLTALTAVIPLVGATLGAVLVTLVVVTDSLGKALATIAFYVVYQQLENYVIAPRVFARAINLPPLVVFLAVLVGAGLAGFVGAIVALPAAAAVKAVTQYELRERGVSSLGTAARQGSADPERQAGP